MRRTATWTLRATLLILACAWLAACASGGTPRRVSEPAIAIQQLTVRADGSWALDLRIDNFSSVPMRFDGLRLALSVDGEAAGTLQAAPGVSVGPEAADIATTTLAPSPGARIAMADALTRGRSIGYHLEGSLSAAPENGGARDFRIKRDSALSPVPGLAGVLR